MLQRVQALSFLSRLALRNLTQAWAKNQPSLRDWFCNRSSRTHLSLIRPAIYGRAFEPVFSVVSLSFYEFGHPRHPNSTLPTLPEARQKTAFDGKPRKGRYFRPLHLGRHDRFVPLCRCGSSRKQEILSMKRKMLTSAARVLSLLLVVAGSCALAQRIQVKALHWPDQRLFTLKYEC